MGVCDLVLHWTINISGTECVANTRYGFSVSYVPDFGFTDITHLHVVLVYSIKATGQETTGITLP